MDIYWQSVRRGQNLMLSDAGTGREERIGGFRENQQGIDAYAATTGYEPGRSQKGFPSIEAAKVFVESFRPWEIYGAQDVTVEPEVRPAGNAASRTTDETSDSPPEAADPPPEAAYPPPGGPDPPPGGPDPPPEAIAPEPQTGPVDSQPSSRGKWWEFWKKG